MCHAVKCKVCGKTTWAGCGQHISQVRASVPEGHWCDGNHTPEEMAEARSARGGLLGRVFGR